MGLYPLPPTHAVEVFFELENRWIRLRTGSELHMRKRFAAIVSANLCDPKAGKETGTAVRLVGINTGTVLQSAKYYERVTDHAAH